MSRKPNFDVNDDRRTKERTDVRTEIWTPISHPAIRRCDKNHLSATDDNWSLIFDSPSNIVSKVSFDSSTLTLVISGTILVCVGFSCTCRVKNRH